MIDKDLYPFTFNGLTVLYGVQSLDICKTGDDLIYSSGNDIVFEIGGMRRSEDYSFDSKVLLELCSADDAERLYITEEVPYDGEISTTIKSKLLQKPGKYYLQIYNASPQDNIQHRFDVWKGAYRYTFYLLENGELLQHPSLKQVSLSPNLKLRLDWTTVQTELDHFDVIAYNEDWELMGKLEHLSFCSSSFKYFLSSPFMWVDGNYFMVVSHNGEPFLRIDFCWKENSATSFTWEQLDALSPYYLLGKYLRKDTAWHYWQKVSGGAKIRRQVAASFLNYAFDQKRMCLGLPGCWKSGHHFALILEDNVYDKEQMRQLSNLMNPQLTYLERDCNDLLDRRTEATPGSNIKGVMNDWSGAVLCLHHLSAIMMPGGNVLLQAVEEHLQEDDRCVLMLVGSMAEVEQVMKASSFIGRLMNKGTVFRLEDPSLAEQLHWVQRFLVGKSLSLSEEAGKKIYEGLQRLRNEGCVWKTNELQEWMKDEVLSRFTRRILLSPSAKNQQAKELFSLIEADDIYFPETQRKSDEFSANMEKLHQMVGLKGLKENLKTLFCRSRMDEKRRLLGLPVTERGGYHMVFTGNPGTGKTTVAQMVGRVFHSLGILSKGGVIVTERSKLVGRYIGDTENNMQALLEQAKGNVLFIDEAYNLYDGGDTKKDYGHRVIESLLTVLSQKNPDLIVILAGYEKEMMNMLETNPGMKGRFPYHFHFEDYNADELLQIAHNQLSRLEYILTPQADKRLEETIAEVVANKDVFFHNARWVEQYIENGILTAMSKRLADLAMCVEDKSLYQTIEAEDIENAYRLMKPQKAEKKPVYRRIGFVA